jgi:hypothetical protein
MVLTVRTHDYFHRVIILKHLLQAALCSLISLSLGGFGFGQTSITSGGKYSGNFVSKSPSAPAISIQTTEPVTIAHSTIISRNSGILCVPGANLTVTECYLIAQNPNVENQTTGTAIYAYAPSALTVTRCHLDGWCQGITVDGSAGSAPTTATIQIELNHILQTNGRPSNGNNGWFGTAYLNAQGIWEDEGGGAHSIVLFHTHQDPNITIQYNEIAQPIATSDVINLYGSSGTETNPILIQGNYVEGPLPNPPETVQIDTANGIVTDNPTTDSADTTRYVTIQNNYICRSKGGISLFAGDHLTAQSNYVAFTGLTPSGTRYGVYSWGITLDNGVTPNQETNLAIGNTVGVINPQTGKQTAVINELKADNSKNNTILSTVTSATEGDAYMQWLEMLQANGLAPGGPSK